MVLEFIKPGHTIIGLSQDEDCPTVANDFHGSRHGTFLVCKTALLDAGHVSHSSPKWTHTISDQFRVRVQSHRTDVLRPAGGARSICRPKVVGGQYSPCARPQHFDLQVLTVAPGCKMFSRLRFSPTVSGLVDQAA